VPTGGERASLGFAIADYATNQQVRIVERGAISVSYRIAEFAAFVDGAGRLWRDVTGDSAGKRKLFEESSQAIDSLRDMG